MTIIGVGCPVKRRLNLFGGVNMPRGDGTGPMGAGPMTGRGAGYCNGNAAPGYAEPVGFGGGFGRGRGFGGMYCRRGMPGWGRYGYGMDAAPYARAFDEKAFLENRASVLEAQLSQIKERLAGLDEEAE